MYNMSNCVKPSTNLSCVKYLYVPIRNTMDLLNPTTSENAPFSIYDASSYTEYKKNRTLYQQYKKDVCTPTYGSYSEKQSITKGYKNINNKCLCKN